MAILILNQLRESPIVIWTHLVAFEVNTWTQYANHKNLHPNQKPLIYKPSMAIKILD
jgi:hypothetical protein